MVAALHRVWRATIAHIPFLARPTASRDHPRVGEYFADYGEPSREEIDADDPACKELFDKSEIVSTKR